MRIYLLDELRGVSIIFMVLFHAIYQVVIWFNLSYDILYIPVVRFFQLSAQILFISICGACCILSKNNFKRGAVCFTLGLIITVITSIIIPSEKIVFGILSFLGTAILIYCLLKKLILKIPCIVGILVCLPLFIICYIVIYSSMVVETITTSSNMNYLYNKGVFTLLGLPSPTFYSSDFFPLIPWLFLFISGIYIGIIITKIKNKHIYINYLPALSYIGKHSLLIYIVHIPVILGVIFIIKLLI